MNKEMWLTLAKLLAPIIIGVVKPSLAPLGSAIGHGIAEAEMIPGASGADKLAHVKAITADVATSLNTASGKVMIDPTNLNVAITSAVNATVAAINAVHNDYIITGDM